MNIISILMDRDNMTEEEATSLVEDARQDLYYRLENGEQPENICQEWFGLEPDYLTELI